jgi:hypothetical protein
MHGGIASVDCWFILTSAVHEENRRRKEFEVLRLRRERLEQARSVGHDGAVEASRDATPTECVAGAAAEKAADIAGAKEAASRDAAGRMEMVVLGVAFQLQLQTGFDRDDIINMVAESAFPPSRRVEIRQAVEALNRSGWNAELLAFVWNEYPREAEELSLPKPPLEKLKSPGGLTSGGVGKPIGGDRPAESFDGDAKPKAYLQGWPEILSALGKKNNDSEKTLVSGWNQKYEGPIMIAGAGSRPKVERTKLIAWWNRLEIQFETENRARDAAATVESTHRHGRDGVVAPEIAGSVRKRRNPNPKPDKT